MHSLRQILKYLIYDMEYWLYQRKFKKINNFKEHLLPLNQNLDACSGICSANSLNFLTLNSGFQTVGHNPLGVTYPAYQILAFMFIMVAKLQL